MKNQKLWGVIKKSDGKIFDTSSIFFTKISSQEWLADETVRFGIEIAKTLKVVGIEINIL